MFTYDACFNSNCAQEEVFNKCVRNLVLGCFSGFNATVLAYGQTGSGKTWTMGSGYTSDIAPEQYGIIPRVINLIFDEVDRRKHKTEFIVKCSFLEIYNEELNDLLDPMLGNSSKQINIREEKNGTISVYGLREEKVENADEMAYCLDKGSNSRTTASTLMNSQSSRSHAIFTITIE
jgi:kinesin family protein 4/21/27